MIKLQDREEILESESLNYDVNPPFMTEEECSHRLVKNPLDLVISNHLDTLPKF